MDRIHRENENSERRDVRAPPESGDADTGRFHPYGEAVVGGMENQSGENGTCHQRDSRENYTEQGCWSDPEKRVVKHTEHCADKQAADNRVEAVSKALKK